MPAYSKDQELNEGDGGIPMLTVRQLADRLRPLETVVTQQL